MGITTFIIQILLVFEITVFSILLIPFPHKDSILQKMSTNVLYRGLRHILLAVYGMISLLFFDSVMKKYKGSENIYYMYHAERNLYLTSFTLFLALVLNTFIKMIVKTKDDAVNAAILRKQALNQKEFVAKIMEKSKEKEKKIIAMEEEIKKNEIMIRQLKNNSNEYFKLLDKYNDLVEKITGEKKKNR